MSSIQGPAQLPGGLLRLSKATISVVELNDHFPVSFRCANKNRIYNLVKDTIGDTYRQLANPNLVFSRFNAAKLPKKFPERKARVELVESFYDYNQEYDRNLFTSSQEDGKVETVLNSSWHVDFADPGLFAFYQSDLFAQDEHVMLEHPVTGSLRMCLTAPRDELKKTAIFSQLSQLDEKNNPTDRETAASSLKNFDARTDDRVAPTPCLMFNVPKVFTIDTVGAGIYGNAFQAASKEKVISSTTVHNPPKISNILAMAAPAYGEGRYKSSEISRGLITAYTSFLAAVHESMENLGVKERSEVRVLVHTGDWGSGAFGNNRVLMTVLQLAAADLSRIDALVYHTLEPDDFKKALEVYSDLRFQSDDFVFSFVKFADDMEFEWGTGNHT
jgi:hypothetical protein